MGRAARRRAARAAAPPACECPPGCDCFARFDRALLAGELTTSQIERLHAAIAERVAARLRSLADFPPPTAAGF